jgi:hypothetical protein
MDKVRRESVMKKQLEGSDRLGFRTLTVEPLVILAKDMKREVRIYASDIVDAKVGRSWEVDYEVPVEGEIPRKMISRTKRKYEPITETFNEELILVRKDPYTYDTGYVVTLYHDLVKTDVNENTSYVFREIIDIELSSDPGEDDDDNE